MKAAWIRLLAAGLVAVLLHQPVMAIGASIPAHSNHQFPQGQTSNSLFDQQALQESYVMAYDRPQITVSARLRQAIGAPVRALWQTTRDWWNNLLPRQQFVWRVSGLALSFGLLIWRAAYSPHGPWDALSIGMPMFSISLLEQLNDLLHKTKTEVEQLVQPLLQKQQEAEQVRQDLQKARDEESALRAALDEKIQRLTTEAGEAESTARSKQRELEDLASDTTQEKQKRAIKSELGEAQKKQKQAILELLSVKDRLKKINQDFQNKQRKVQEAELVVERMEQQAKRLADTILKLDGDIEREVGVERRAQQALSVQVEPAEFDSDVVKAVDRFRVKIQHHQVKTKVTDFELLKRILQDLLTLGMPREFLDDAAKHEYINRATESILMRASLIRAFTVDFDAFVAATEPDKGRKQDKGETIINWKILDFRTENIRKTAAKLQQLYPHMETRLPARYFREVIRLVAGQRRAQPGESFDDAVRRYSGTYVKPFPNAGDLAPDVEEPETVGAYNERLQKAGLPINQIYTQQQFEQRLEELKGNGEKNQALAIARFQVRALLQMTPKEKDTIAKYLAERYGIDTSLWQTAKKPSKNFERFNTEDKKRQPIRAAA